MDTDNDTHEHIERPRNTFDFTISDNRTVVFDSEFDSGNLSQVIQHDFNNVTMTFYHDVKS